MTIDRQKSTLEDVIHEAIRGSLLETHTALPGVVESFDAASVRATIRVPLRRVTRDLEGVKSEDDWPQLVDVPVWMPHAGGFSISLPVAAGDEALVIFLERDAGRWFEDSVEQRPETLRRHSLSDAVALVGLNSQPNRISPYNAQDLEISNDAGSQSVILRANGDIELTNAKLGLGAGAEDVLGVMAEICDLISGMTVNTTTGVAIPPTTTAAAALKARINAVKV